MIANSSLAIKTINSEEIAVSWMKILSEKVSCFQLKIKKTFTRKTFSNLSLFKKKIIFFSVLLTLQIVTFLATTVERKQNFVSCHSLEHKRNWFNTCALIRFKKLSVSVQIQKNEKSLEDGNSYIAKKLRDTNKDDLVSSTVHLLQILVFHEIDKRNRF